MRFFLDAAITVTTITDVTRPKKRRLPRPSEAAKALDEFIKTNKIPLRIAAKALGVSHPTLLSWFSGVSKPKNELREAIEVWTGGAIAASAWMTASERVALDKVKPFEKDGKDAA